MANSFTNINDTIIVQDAFEAFKAGMAPLSGLSTSYDSEASQKSEVIRVPVATGRSAASRADGATYEVDTGNTIATTAVTLNQQQHVPWYLPDGAAGKTAVKVWEASARECAYALAKKIFDDTLNLFTESHTTGFGDRDTFDVITVAVGSFDLDDVVTLQQMLKSKGSIGPMSMYLTTAGASSLRKDNQIQNAAAFGTDEVLRSGEFNMPIYGMRAFEVTSFPATIAGQNTYGIVAVPSAVALAVRPIEPQDTSKLIDWQVVSDSDTGLSMGYRRWYNESTGIMWGTFEALYGLSVVRPAADSNDNTAGAVRVKSA